MAIMKRFAVVVLTSLFLVASAAAFTQGHPTSQILNSTGDPFSGCAAGEVLTSQGDCIDPSTGSGGSGSYPGDVFVNESGDTMNGNLDMNTYNITNSNVIDSNTITSEGIGAYNQICIDTNRNGVFQSDECVDSLTSSSSGGYPGDVFVNESGDTVDGELTIEGGPLDINSDTELQGDLSMDGDINIVGDAAMIGLNSVDIRAQDKICLDKNGDDSYSGEECINDKKLGNLGPNQTLTKETTAVGTEIGITGGNEITVEDDDSEYISKDDDISSTVEFDRIGKLVLPGGDSGGGTKAEFESYDVGTYPYTEHHSKLEMKQGKICLEGSCKGEFKFNDVGDLEMSGNDIKNVGSIEADSIELDTVYNKGSCTSSNLGEIVLEDKSPDTELELCDRAPGGSYVWVTLNT